MNPPIQAQALAGYVLSIVIGIAAGKIEPDIPWWVVCGAAINMFSLIAVFTMYTKKDDAPATRSDIIDALAAHDLELKSFREAIDSLPMEPLGEDGTTYAPLPDRTRAVRLPDGTIRLALPVYIAGIGSATFPLTVDPIRLDVVDGKDTPQVRDPYYR